MNIKDVAEIRRHIRRERSNMTAIYGCYVNSSKEIVAEFRSSTGMMSENEGDKYFSVMRKTLTGTIGKHLIDIRFQTAQVADSPEHKLLMDLRQTSLGDEELRMSFYRKVIESVSMEEAYLILLGCDSYDVPFKKEGAEETFKFLLCAICPVKLTKATLHYVPEEKLFHDGGITQVASAPELGFLFPAFDDRATNIYNALMYTHDSAKGHEAFVEAVFNTKPAIPAAEQKKSFEGLLGSALGEECSMEVVQAVHDELCQAIELHKESRVADPLLITREQVSDALKTCAISETGIAKFNVQFDETFGNDAMLHPKNIINNKKFEINTPDVSIRVDPSRSDLIETRVIGGVKYILICADENVEVNGVSIHIGDEKE